jgi:hypothetical protein
MPKVMMIGKVSKLKSRTRRAGSFKGSLGTVVLEGSRAQSRRYGMGNIAGSPAEHMDELRDHLAFAHKSLQALRQSPSCWLKMNRAAQALEAIGTAQASLPWIDKPSRSRYSSEIAELRRSATNALHTCARPESATMSGARRRRRSR